MKRFFAMLSAAALAVSVLSCGASAPDPFVETWSGDDFVLNIDRWGKFIYATWEVPSVPTFGYAISPAPWNGDVFVLDLYDHSTDRKAGRVEGYFEGFDAIKAVYSHGGVSRPLKMSRHKDLPAVRILTREVVSTAPGFPNEPPSLFRFFSFEPAAQGTALLTRYRTTVGGSLEASLSMDMENFFNQYAEVGAMVREENPEVPLHPWRYEGWRVFAYRGPRYFTTMWQSSVVTGEDSAPSATSARVFDALEGRVLSLGDVIKPEAFARLGELLTEEATTMEGQSLLDARFFDSVVYPTEMFGICNGGLIFHYNMGELGPLDLGERWYVLSWAKLSGSLTEEFEAFAKSVSR